MINTGEKYQQIKLLINVEIYNSTTTDKCLNSSYFKWLQIYNKALSSEEIEYIYTVNNAQNHLIWFKD